MEPITPSDEEEYLCPVCLEEILTTEGQALTECCHNVFHLSCMILTYTQRTDNKTKCPMCRGNICKQLHTVCPGLLSLGNASASTPISSLPEVGLNLSVGDINSEPEQQLDTSTA